MHRRIIVFCSWLAGVSWLALAAFLASGVSNEHTRFSFCIAALCSGVLLWRRIETAPQVSAEAERRAKLRGAIVVLNAISVTGWAGLAVWAYVGESTATSRCMYALLAMVSVTPLWLRISRAASAHAAGYEQGFEAGYERGHQAAATGRPPRVLVLDQRARDRLQDRRGRSHTLRVVPSVDVRRDARESFDART